MTEMHHLKARHFLASHLCAFLLARSYTRWTMGAQIGMLNSILLCALLALCSALVSYLRKPEQGNALTRTPAASNTLHSLPTELILLIAGFLRPVDLHCLSLCSRWTSMVLDGQRRKLRYRIDCERCPLLYRLDRDLLDRFVCHECYSLHEYDASRDFDLPHPFDFRPTHPCLMHMSEHHKLLLYEGDLYLTAPRFYFLHLQLAMKRFHCGPAAGISSDSLFIIQVSQTKSATTLLCREALVCCQPPALQLRVQDIILFHGDQEISEKTVGGFIICHHQRNPKLVLLMQRLKPLFAEGKDAISTGLCSKCNTEYQVELHSIQEDAIRKESAFVITRWIDLGSGIEPIDPRWTVHAKWIPKGYPTSLDLNPMRHNPRAVFEEACAKRNSLDHLRSRNLSYLDHQNYKKVMKRWWSWGSHWYLWQKNVS